MNELNFTLLSGIIDTRLIKGKFKSKLDNSLMYITLDGMIKIDGKNLEVGIWEGEQLTLGKFRSLDELSEILKIYNIRKCGDYGIKSRRTFMGKKYKFNYSWRYEKELQTRVFKIDITSCKVSNKEDELIDLIVKFINEFESGTNLNDFDYKMNVDLIGNDSFVEIYYYSEYGENSQCRKEILKVYRELKAKYDV